MSGRRALAGPESLFELLNLGSPDESVWVLDGLCAETDPEVFFPALGEPTRPAKRVCAACSVREACLAYALEHHERFGVWGGTTERERRALRRSMASMTTPDRLVA